MQSTVGLFVAVVWFLVRGSKTRKQETPPQGEDRLMDMILLDWTRMGKSYCLAGVVHQNGQLRVVRPLLARHRDAPVRNVGWPSLLMDGHSRWEVFELIGAEPAEPRAPHLEDVWVRAMRSRYTLANPAQRRAILQATLAPPDAPWFGDPLVTTRSTAYLPPNIGARSLASLLVPARAIRFTASWRDGVPEPDYRVALGVPGLEERSLPVKDHFLLHRAETASPSVDGRIRQMTFAIAQMGEQVAVRLGLSRSFQATPARGESFCWLMADSFFSFNDPQC